jgi:miniconductance mechanosensitive channel
MTKSNGRRIKRALLIDVKSVAFFNAQQVSELLTTLDSTTFSELIDQTKPHYTNIGLFRLYCECYMTSHPMVNQNMTLMARQLAPSEHGIAIELYCFCSDKRWIEYEIAQAELIEHLLACMPLFGIKAYQTR